MKANTTQTCEVQESERKFKTLPLSQWGNFFLSILVDELDMDALSQEMETLKAKVRDMLMSCSGVESTKKRILCIYVLMSLGVAYQFQDEIDEILKQDFDYIEKMVSCEDDLYVTSTIFWVFRTFGYNMWSDVFKKFTEENGKFKESLIVDLKGLVSLYEAAYLRTTTEHIMDEALSFTTSNLKSLVAAGACPSHITTRIQNALCMPQLYNLEMLFAKEHISFYEQEEGHNKMLLRFSKIHFKFLQLNWIRELRILIKWWKEQNLASKLPPYFRDQMIECYLFSFMIYFEPQFSRARIEIAKLYTLLTLIDDTCDRYGSISEVSALVHCVERYNLLIWFMHVKRTFESLITLVKGIFIDSRKDSLHINRLADCLRECGPVIILEFGKVVMCYPELECLWKLNHIRSWQLRLI